MTTITAVTSNNKANKNSNTKILSGTIIVDKDLVFENPVLIKPGTTFFIEEGISLIFKNKLIAIGDKDSKINFLSNSNKPWGTIAIIGKDTAGSKLKHIDIKDGSGSFLSRIQRMNKLGLSPKKQVPIEVEEEDSDIVKIEGKKRKIK